MQSLPRTTYNEVEKFWYGNKVKPTYGENDSLGSAILDALQKNPQNIAQISASTGKEYTSQEIRLLSIRIAQHLEKLNLQQTDVVGLCAANSDLVAPLFFACLCKGFIISTLDPSFDEDGIKHIYSITKPKLMFCDGAIYHRVRKAFDECGLSATAIYTVKDHIEGVPKLTDLIEETQREHEFKSVELLLGGNQIAVIVCSSGTTGLPKGVCLSNTAILNATGGMPPIPSRILCFSTLYWMSGVFSLIGPTFIPNYTRVISDKPFSAEYFLQIVKQYSVTIFIGPPSQIGLLVACPKLQKGDLTNLKFFFCGGSAVPQISIDKLKHYAPDLMIMVGYGQTEIGTGVSNGPAVEDGNCGQLSTNMEVKIIDDDNRNLSPGEIGEICSRSLYTWPGYYGNPEATASTYDSERWIHSGDLGYIDDKGNLYVVDRKKDILKYNNFHFYPTEIEIAILELSDVIEVSVCGIPDLIYTNLPAAAIVKVPGSTLTEKMVCEYIADRMAHYKHLRGGVYFFEELPKTASGKILRRNVAELCQRIHNDGIDK